MSINNNPVPYPPQGVTQLFTKPYQVGPPQGTIAGGFNPNPPTAQAWELEVTTVPTDVELELSTVATTVEFLLPPP